MGGSRAVRLALHHAVNCYADSLRLTEHRSTRAHPTPRRSAARFRPSRSHAERGRSSLATSSPESNMRTRFRKPLLYPPSYGAGGAQCRTSPFECRRHHSAEVPRELQGAPSAGKDVERWLAQLDETAVPLEDAERGSRRLHLVRGPLREPAQRGSTSARTSAPGGPCRTLPFRRRTRVTGRGARPLAPRRGGS